MPTTLKTAAESYWRAKTLSRATRIRVPHNAREWVPRTPRGVPATGVTSLKALPEIRPAASVVRKGGGVNGVRSADCEALAFHR
jgi:hypothetical protein